jgi:Peptidase S24-like
VPIRGEGWVLGSHYANHYRKNPIYATGKILLATEKDFSYFGQMSDAESPHALSMAEQDRAIVAEFADKFPGGKKGLSKALGRNAAYIDQFIKRGKGSIPSDLRAKMLELGAPLPDSKFFISYSSHSRRNEDLVRALERGLSDISSPSQIPPLWRDSVISVKSQVVSGRNGGFTLNGEDIAWIRRPEALDGVVDAYAVNVHGDTMMPRLREGWRVYVNPSKAPTRGCDALAQIADKDGLPLGYIKEFVGHDERFLKLKQLNPSKILRFPARKVIAVHRIIQWAEQ